MMKVLTVTLHPAVDRIIRTTRLLLGEPIPSQLIKVYAAGKGINAARSLHRLGVSVLAIGFQGGSNGDFSIESLKNEGISSHFIQCKASTRLTMIIHEEISGKRFVVYEPRQVVSKIESADLLDYFDQVVGEFELCLLCGAGEGPQLETMYQEMIKQAKKQHVPCMLDSSGLSLLNGIKAKPNFVKINLDELAGFVKRKICTLEDQREALKTIIENGVNYAAVSNQAKGLLATDGKQSWVGKFVPRKVINTIGCGDAMFAGMANAALHSLPLPEIVRGGVACGAANTQNIGAGFITQDTIRDFHQRVDIHQLAV